MLHWLHMMARYSSDTCMSLITLLAGGSAEYEPTSLCVSFTPNGEISINNLHCLNDLPFHVRENQSYSTCVKGTLTICFPRKKITGALQ
ncbi:hypothetical protein XELAEV_18032185mg [Xenopus laevis]|uniref:Uncharacterized protein n=1 Tax=Xenopus laevis TaxID=8355 RepID=A0A974HGC8_XENLA|nr:hypothetical protein XELAEV_18032185mg [Xenopus laevis]